MSQADQGNNNVPVKIKRGRPMKHPQPNNSGHNAAASGSCPHVLAENGVGLGDPMIRRNEVLDVHGSSTCAPSAPPPPPPPPPSNGSTVETQGRENNEVATWVNQPSTEVLLQAEARSMILPEMPFEELVTEVVKRIHDPSS
ncbi:hypothetical protein ACE6H2_014877 [Prunus campanulata]